MSNKEYADVWLRCELLQKDSSHSEKSLKKALAWCVDMRNRINKQPVGIVRNATLEKVIGTHMFIINALQSFFVES